MSGARLADAASSLVGIRFRLCGRDPAQGLDCIGVLQAALERCGHFVNLPQNYTLRINDLSMWIPAPESCGMITVSGEFQLGDVVLSAVGPAQFHLSIRAADGGWIHAHAGLRRVVHQPLPPPGPILHHWRLAPDT